MKLRKPTDRTGCPKSSGRSSHSVFLRPDAPPFLSVLRLPVSYGVERPLQIFTGRRLTPLIARIQSQPVPKSVVSHHLIHQVEEPCSLVLGNFAIGLLTRRPPSVGKRPILALGAELIVDLPGVLDLPFITFPCRTAVPETRPPETRRFPRSAKDPTSPSSRSRFHTTDAPVHSPEATDRPAASPIPAHTIPAAASGPAIERAASPWVKTCV